MYRTYDLKLAVTPHPEGVELQWNSQGGQTYRVTRTTSLAEGFVAIATNVPATPRWNTFLDDQVPESSSVYYRVTVE